MSVRWDANSDLLSSGTNAPTSSTAWSVGGWAKLINVGAGTTRPFATLFNSGFTVYQILFIDTDNNFKVGTNAANTAFASNPSTTGWFYFAMTCQGTGATDLKAYWRNNVDVAFTTQSMTGNSFTPANFYVGSSGTTTWTDQEMRYVRCWNAALSSAEFLTESQSATVVRTSNLQRNMILAAGASAGTDSSGNGFNMTASGLSDGASEPTFGGGRLVGGCLAGAPVLLGSF